MQYVFDRDRGMMLGVVEMCDSDRCALLLSRSCWKVC
jgi:hypothetical protein